MEECIYCTIQVTKRDRGDHETVCGAKTEQCPKCMHYIANKDMKAHNGFTCCPDELEVNKQLVYIDKKSKARLKNSNTKLDSIDKVPLPRYSNGFISSSRNSVDSTINSKPSFKKFDMQVGSIKDKDINSFSDNPNLSFINEKNNGLGKSISKPGFVKQEFKLNPSSNALTQSITEKPKTIKENGNNNKPQINKLSSFKNVPLKEPSDVNDINKYYYYY